MNKKVKEALQQGIKELPKCGRVDLEKALKHISSCKKCKKKFLGAGSAVVESLGTQTLWSFASRVFSK